MGLTGPLRGSGGSGGGSSGVGSSASNGPTESDSHWQKAFSKTHQRPYWFNTRTGASRWEPPVTAVVGGTRGPGQAIHTHNDGSNPAAASVAAASGALEHLGSGGAGTHAGARWDHAHSVDGVVPEGPRGVKRSQRPSDEHVPAAGMGAAAEAATHVVQRPRVHRAARFVAPELPLPHLATSAAAAASAHHCKIYVANIGYLSKPMLATVLGDAWREVSVHEARRIGRVDLIVIDGAFWKDRSTVGLECGIKSRVDTSRQRLHKFELHSALHEAGSRFIPECILYDTRSGPAPRLPPGVWIWRPTVKVGGGHGVAVVTTQSDLDREVRRMPSLRADRGVLTRYIRNPLLFHYGGHGYKCHLRMYFLAVTTSQRPGLVRSALYRHGEIDLALVPYVDGDYANVDVHDTRRAGVILARGKGQVIRFPEEFPGGTAAAANAFREMAACLSEVSRHAFGQVGPYPGCEVGYNVFGTDFLLDDRGHVYLLEMNAAPGFPDEDPAVTMDLSGKIFGGVKEFVLDFSPHTPLRHVVHLQGAATSTLGAIAGASVHNGPAEAKPSLTPQSVGTVRCDAPDGRALPTGEPTKTAPSKPAPWCEAVTDLSTPLTFFFGRELKTNLIALHIVDVGPLLKGTSGPRSHFRFIVTVYYKRGTRIHQYTTDPDCMAYNPRSDLVHNHDPLHGANLHKLESPYELHSHVLVTEEKLWRFIEKLVARQLDDTDTMKSKIAPAIAAQIRSTASRQCSGPRDVTFPDGSRATFSFCADDQVFNRQKDVHAKLEAAGGDRAQESAILREAMKFVRADMAIEYIEGIAEKVTMERMASERFWKTNSLIHVLVETGSIDALAYFLRSYPKLFSPNVARPKDGCTPLHVACWKRDDAEREAQFEDLRGPIIDVLLTAGADIRPVNKYGETVADHPLVKQSLENLGRRGAGAASM